ncbi:MULTISPECIES: four helix bundle protein [Chitinophagaceae]
MGEKIQRFEELLVWQKAQDFACLIYGNFSYLKDYSFKDQICRASVSISSNVAERFEKRSAKEFLRYLDIAKTSGNEVRSLLHLALKLQFINEDSQLKLLEQSHEIGKMLYALMNSIRLKNNL